MGGSPRLLLVSFASVKTQSPGGYETPHHGDPKTPKLSLRASGHSAERVVLYLCPSSLSWVSALRGWKAQHPLASTLANDPSLQGFVSKALHLVYVTF